ncbi:hypothetical protein [Sanyastnella coralliicola]|uniref:hypothetical protein n=1 Tax=Sanyastnella coralliicola TaxID=3069118 RepID=UPI0027B9C0BA|nr:hypothetical protein [Longitalea sp. SCSIO 12813]
MKFLLITYLLLSMTTGGEEELSQCRALYFQLGDKENAEAFLDQCEELGGVSPIAKGYEGCAKTVMAGYGFNPFSKYNLFAEGRDELEAAIKSAPTDPELRFLRLGVQIHAPGFLNYDDQIDQDIELIVSALANGWASDTPWFQEKVISFLQDSCDLDSASQSTLKNL